MSRLSGILIVVLLVQACRSTTPVRTPDDAPASIRLQRINETAKVSWRIVPTEGKDSIVTTRKKMFENPDSHTWNDTGQPVAVAMGIDTDSKEAYLPEGDYGNVYLMQVVESDGAAQNTIRILDDREPALAIGAEIGLLFVPELDGALASTIMSVYPGRIWAIDSNEGPSAAHIVDRISIDAGVVGGSVIGDAPPELDGRAAFSLGLGFFLAKGWSLKGGVIIYRDARDGDSLTESGYWGVTYDLLSGLSSK